MHHSNKSLNVNYFHYNLVMSISRIFISSHNLILQNKFSYNRFFRIHSNICYLYYSSDHNILLKTQINEICIDYRMIRIRDNNFNAENCHC